MKILFSPSEAKIEGGNLPHINKDNFIFPNLYEDRVYVIEKYQNFLKDASKEDLQKLFGIKKEDQLEILSQTNMLHDKTIPAILRYSGVAYEYLKYPALKEKEKIFIDDNVIIFSNIFGPILAKNPIPNYKLKQGEKLDTFVIEKYYKEHFSSSLDEFLKDELVIDLRAGFYLKFYTLKQNYITMKFIKNGKVVSHWAKAYRGIIARYLAKYQPQNEKELQKIPFEDLKIKEIIQSKYKKEYVYEIIG